MASHVFNLNDTIFHDLALWIHQSPSIVDNLYASPFAVHAVFRALPPLARVYIARLLYLPSDQPIPLAAFQQTLRRRQRAKDRNQDAIYALRSLNVFYNPFVDSIDVDEPKQQPPETEDDSLLRLHPRFAVNLRHILANELPSAFGGPVDHELIPAAELDQFSADRLEAILNYLVESSGLRPPSGNVVPALVRAHILEQNRSALCITSSGFHFLLKHSFAQLWILLRSVLIACFTPNILDPLLFLFTLSLTRPGATYSTRSLSAEQSRLLPDLHELGIVMLQEHYFVPTSVGVRLLKSANRVGADLSSADLPSVTKTTGEIDIFVETNFRVYAYTSSPFQTNLLGLFTKLRFHLPRMVAGHLTREAVRRALINGITGEQIISYLNAHAHPRMNRGVIPPNVSDEIRLWEAEQERAQFTAGILLAEFQTDSAFERVVSFAKEADAILWTGSQRRQIIVSDEHANAVKQFIRQAAIQ